MKIKNFLKIKKLSYFVSDPALILLLFLYIYAPEFSFLPFQGLGLILPPSTILLYALSKNPKSITRFLFKNKIIVTFQFLLLALFLLALFLDIYGGSNNQVKFSIRYPIIIARFYFGALVSSVALYHLFDFSNKKMNGTNLENLITSFFVIIFIQFVIVFISLLNPSLRDFFNFQLLKPPAVMADEATFFYNRRGYGIASGYAFSYPLFNGFVMSLSLWSLICTREKSKKIIYLICAAIAIIPIMLNARVGLIAIPCFFLSLFLIKPFNVGLTIKRVKLMFAILVLLNPLYALIINYFNSSTIDWLLAGIEQFTLAFTLNFEEVRYLQGFSNEDYIPQNFLFGDGMYLFNNENAYTTRSDIGYVNYFYFGGILYSLLLYGTFAWFFIRVLLESKAIKIKGVILSTLIMFFIANVKGMVFFDNELTRGFFLLLVFVVFDAKHRNQYQKFHSG
ncbi:MAG: hypothetical protein KA717_37190 [Woronichinia naegeliana WA131]|uniref:Uncharacterized protein n=1 Tax=Woronichinia naegeliana WA131 TaxID=2824559 RepID=A0A977KW20_9CYAN|nr:MAG: hypothetical protein KA717_37190 [Woronichinia naegeliana WA131]